MQGLLYLTNDEVRQCTPDTSTVLDAVEEGVRSFAKGEATAYATVSLPGATPGTGVYTIRGSMTSLGLAIVKTVGSFPGNREVGLPPDPGLCSLIDLSSGVPLLVAQASWLTTLRTAAMTALGARTLSRQTARVIGCIGARGIAPLAAEMMVDFIADVEVRIHSRQAETRERAADIFREKGVRVDTVKSWDDCVSGADIVIDGAGLASDAPLLDSALIAPGAAVISYGAYCSLDDMALETIDRVIVDRWDPSPSGALGRLIGTGQMSEETIDAYFGDILLNNSVGRRSDDERILFWHRGLAACDITLSRLLLDAARELNLGTELAQC